jgi:hypothetical protein
VTASISHVNFLGRRWRCTDRRDHRRNLHGHSCPNAG